MKYDLIAEAYKNLYESSIDSIITEEIHPLIQQTLNAGYNKHHRYNLITRTVRNLASSGIDTGLTDDKPKKGSSRAVMFVKDTIKAKIDGVDAEIPHVLKIAFRGNLDKYSNHDNLLGELQNKHEINSRHHAMIYQTGLDEYATNPNGFLPPILDFHEDGHWMSVGKVSPVKSPEFRELTKTEGFKKGISPEEFRVGLLHHVYQAHGKRTPGWMLGNVSSERASQLISHPLVQKAVNFCLDTDTSPHDFGNRNLGIWEHPVTKERHIVASDAGYSDDVMKAYQKAFENKSKQRKIERKF